MIPSDGLSDPREAFLGALAAAVAPSGYFNPWAMVCPLQDLAPDAPAARLDRLRRFLSVDATLVLVGEAPGYQGCRYSGIPFTSERLLCEGEIPRLGVTGRFTSRNLPWSEPSATVVWGTLKRLGLADTTILWNACPWHPQGEGEPLSNRAPDRAQVAAGAAYLRALRGIFSTAAFVAVGNVANDALAKAWIASAGQVRHPAYGGKTEFERGLERIMQG